MNRYLFCIMSAATFLLAACTQPTGPGGKLWFYTHSTDNTAGHASSLTPSSFIYLEKDGSYTCDFGFFDYGKWIYKDKQLFLISNRHSKTTIPVNYLTATEMQTGPEKGPFNNFESQPVSFSSAVENPFSKENNRWRIKATTKETDTSIKERLLNHFRFWELYFTWALNDKIQYIDVRSTPSPIKIYGNGFSLKPNDQLPAEWKEYFFDEADARKASEKIKYLIDNNAIAWPHTENKYKMFIAAFQQIQQKLP